MNENVKKKIYIGMGITVIIIIISLIIYFSVKKSSPVLPPTDKDKNINVKISLTNGSDEKQKTFSVKMSKIKDYTTEFFVEAMIRQSQILDFGKISLVSFSINNKPLTIEDGKISSLKKISTFLEGSSQNDDISLKGTFVIKCLDGEKPSCDVCKSLFPVCGNNGWECGKATTCPTHEEMKKCCPTNFPSCENGNITCGQCTKKDNLPFQDGKTFDCGKIGCTMIGSVCGNDGWSCEANTKCPVGDELQACASGENMIASCITDSFGKTRIVSSTCKEATPEEIKSCPESCDKQGLVCETVNGKKSWVCKKGVHCPSDEKKNSCCSDPLKPIAICSNTSTNIVCQGCDENKKPPCEENCFGQGLSCTLNGWKCENGVKCPTDMSKCCDSNTLPFCDEKEKCVKCGCENGLHSCSESVCGGVNSSKWISPVCCGNDPPCNKPLGATDYMCCDASRSCYDSEKKSYVCCPVGTECKNGECVVMCGKNTDGTNNLCDFGNSCLISENLSENDIAVLKKQVGSENVKIDQTSGNVYTCVPENNSCFFDDFPHFFPNKNGEYYPCYEFPINQDVKCETNFTQYCSRFSNSTDCENPMSVYPNTTFNTLSSSVNISEALQNCEKNKNCSGVSNCVDANGRETTILGTGEKIGSSNCATYVREKSQFCIWNNDSSTGNKCIPKPCTEIKSDNTVGYCITKNETKFDRNELISENQNCENISDSLDCEMPFQEFPNMQAWNAIGDRQSSLEQSKSLCDNNPECNSVVFCPQLGTNPYQLRMGYPVNDQANNCTAYSRFPSKNCKFLNGKCVSKKCESNTNNTLCEKDSNCEWKNILTNDPETIKNDLKYITGNELGNYCSNDNGSFSRLVSINASESCSPVDCWKHVGGNNVIDINFEKNKNGGKCSFISNCETKNNVNPVTRIVNSDGKISNNTFFNPPETLFGKCSETNFPANIDSNYHSGPEGTIQPNLWGCSETQKRCVMTNDGTGVANKEICSSTCCPAPLVRGSDGTCYYDFRRAKVNDGIMTKDTANPYGIFNIPYGVTRCVGTDAIMPLEGGKLSAYDEGRWELCTNVNGCVENDIFYSFEDSDCVVP